MATSNWMYTECEGKYLVSIQVLLGMSDPGLLKCLPLVSSHSNPSNLASLFMKFQYFEASKSRERIINKICVKEAFSQTANT